MELQELKSQIRKALGLSEEVKFEIQIKLLDGTIIVSAADEFVAGADVSVLTEDGTTIALPIGEYETEDGMTFTVEEVGVVAEVSEAEETTEEEETEEVEAEDLAEETTEVEFDKDAYINEVKELMTSLIAKTTSDIENLKAELEEVKKSNTALSEEKEALEITLSEQPAAEPVVINKFAEEKKITKTDLSKMSAQEKYLYNLRK